MLSPGDKVKDCEVIAPLGSGGMATLYLARRRGVGGFSRLVTLKLVHQHLVEDENIIKRFLDEARISAHVAHPNVVHVEEIGQYDGGYFIAMEYVHGVSLAQLLARLTERRLRLRPKLCVWLAAQVAEALHAAHEATGENGVPLDIVHRDVSPQNVLIGHTGHIKLIDFGIAKSQAPTNHRSGAHPLLGKLRYMSPEQLRLERADRRTDVYALGVMLWEMLAGRGLLRCQRFDDERDWATRENPPPPSKYSAHSTPSLDRVVLKAIACAPNDRYDNAFQFRAALLRADPAAVKLDAPMVAALMRSQLGDELDRRRAGWPSEVAGELELTPGVTTSQNWSVEELTAENVGILAPGNDYDEPAREARKPADDDTPTLSMRMFEQGLEAFSDGISAFACRRSEPEPAPAVSRVSRTPLDEPPVENALPALPSALIAPQLDEALRGMPMLLPQSAIDTLKLAPLFADLPKLLPSARSLRAGVIGVVCLLFGVFLGSFLSPAAPHATGPAFDPTWYASLPYMQRDCAGTLVSLATPHKTASASDPMSRASKSYTTRVDSKTLPQSHADASADETAERDAESEGAHGSRTPRKEWHASGGKRGALRGIKPANKTGSSTGGKLASNRKPLARLARTTQ
jgi:serine/threonine protein kinase